MRVLPLAPAAWSFRETSRPSPWRTAVVPGCVHRDLLRHGLIPDPFWGTNEAGLQWIDERDWEYATEFDAALSSFEESPQNMESPAGPAGERAATTELGP